MAQSEIVELDERETDGLRVTLLFNRTSQIPFVRVNDSKTGNNFALYVAPEKIRDAFLHPFAYSAD